MQAKHLNTDDAGAERAIHEAPAYSAAMRYQRTAGPPLTASP